VSSSASSRSTDRGLTGALLALAAFTWWGLAPIYFKAVASVPPLEVLAHRVVWSAVLLTGVVVVRQGARVLLSEFADLKRLGFYGLTALLLSTNWLVFIWAVQSGRLLEASLGYYINPLVNVLLGVLFLRERLNRPQQLAVLLAGLAVGFQVLAYGRLPWVSLTVAFTFGFYGLLRKKAGFDPLRGLLVETLVMLPLALGYIAFLWQRGAGSFGHLGLPMDGLLILSGVVTSVPLILFLEGANRIRLSTLGVMQYVAPTLHFLLAVAVYGELFTWVQGVTFALIWSALGVYSWDAFSNRRRRPGD
jgi:chloramphenicol-sensitive protein RarD